MSSSSTPESYEAYTVAWIAALPHERAAGEAMFDIEHDDSPSDFHKNPADPNAYSWGKIGKHNVVIASLPTGQYGTNAAATVAQGLRSSLPHIRIGLLVGIGAGVPGEVVAKDGTITKQRDIQLGDVVISNPEGTHGGVVQVDFAKALLRDGQQALERKGFLNSPPIAICTALSKLQARHKRKGSKFPTVIARAFEENPLMRADYSHLGTGRSESEAKSDLYHARNGSTIQSEARVQPKFHYGTIASSNVLEKSASHRDVILARLEKEDIRPICFEMEAAGLMNSFPCLVIRGICDYADEHKIDDWQDYAAIAAAAFAKEFLDFVDAEEVQRAQKIVELLEDFKQGHAEIKRTTKDISKSLEEYRVDDAYHKAYVWLSAPDSKSNYDKALKQRQEATGLWFLQGRKFQEWKRRSCPFLWLYGIPGCGKTILSSSIIHDLQAGAKNEHYTVAYFFFDFNDVRKQSFDGALRSLVHHMSSQSRQSSETLLTLYKQHKDGQQQPSLEALQQCLKSQLEISDHTWIVLDALDECITRPELLKWIQDLKGSGFPKLQLIATSREERDIISALAEYMTEEEMIPIQNDEVDADIREVIRSQIEVDRDLQRWKDKPAVREEIETTLMEKARGMFRWAACQLDVLKKCRRLPRLRQALASLPQTLDETYSRILDNIPEQDKDDAIRLLQFMTFSDRPLRLEEAVDAIAVEPTKEPAFNSENRWPQTEEIAAVCSSLVKITKRSVARHEPRFDEDDQNRVIIELQLAHFSVKEYLISERIDNSFKAKLYESSARAMIMQVSTAYLVSAALTTDEKTVTDRPLARYAAEYWMGHAAIAEKGEEDTWPWIEKLLSTHAAYEYWLCNFDPESPWQEPSTSMLPRKPASPLYYVCLSGLSKPAKGLVSQGADVNAQGGRYGNALQAASEEGHIKLAQMLIEKGADVNAQGGHYGNALQAASAEGHIQLAQMLIEKEADVNAQGGHYGNALQAASAEGHIQLAQMLIEKGADVNAQGGNYGNALQAASEGGHMQLAQMLIEKGADVNAQGGLYGNALQAASEGGHMQLAQMLIEKEADVNAQGGYYSNALQAASAIGHIQLAQMLIEKEADVNAQGGHYGNALQAVSAMGHIQLAQMLIEKEADVNAQGGRYSNALQAASAMGHIQLAQMLIEKEADVNAQGGRYGNALQAASARGHIQLAQMLIKKEAEVNAQGGRYGNALQAASAEGHIQLAQMLIEKGVDVNAQGGRYGNALQAASARGHIQLAQMLIEKEAEVNAQGGRYGNALQAASAEGHIQLAQMLIEKGVDVNAQGGNYGNALQAASEWGHIELAQMLIEKGMDVNAQGGRYGNALQAASAEGHIQLAQMLIEKGADVNAQGGNYGNALQAASEWGHIELAQMLIEKGMDVNVQGGRYGNALQAASARGHIQLAQMLIEKEADVNAQGGRYGNALQAASAEGHIQLAQMLIEKGAHVNAQVGLYGNALQAALERGHTELAQMLIEKGMDVNAQGGEYASLAIAIKGTVVVDNYRKSL